MEADVSALAGPKGKHDATRAAVRHGRERGSVTLGGRRVAITRPRVRAAGGSGELPIASYELFSSTEILGKMAMEKMLAGLSTRRYPVGLEPVGQQVDESCSATSKSAVSRKFVAMTETALAELLSRDLSGLDLVALMIDGVHFAESCCVVALGIGIDGVKHPLALVEGSTENATLVTGLLVDLRERGLDVTRPMLVCLDGSKALRKAVLDVLERPVIQRCQLHKVRNVKDLLPQRLRSTVGRKMTDAYHAGSALEAEAALLALATELERTHPGAAASLYSRRRHQNRSRAGFRLPSRHRGWVDRLHLQDALLLRGAHFSRASTHGRFSDGIWAGSAGGGSMRSVAVPALIAKYARTNT